MVDISELVKSELSSDAVDSASDSSKDSVSEASVSSEQGGVPEECGEKMLTSSLSTSLEPSPEDAKRRLVSGDEEQFR